MAGPAELKRLWRKYREYRVSKKRRRSSQATSESSSWDSAALEEAKMMVVGLGLDMKQEEEEEWVAVALEQDPRFVNNPTDIGCSRYYETPYDSVTNSPLSTSPASMRHRVPQYISVNESDEQLPFSKLGPWKPTSFDMMKGKRKGREPGDSAEDRYKFLLDRATSPARFSAKRFKLVRVQA